MSNFSNTYQCYLQGYCGDTDELGLYGITQRQMQATALGVYHRVAAKPPMMSSVDVVAELRRMCGMGPSAAVIAVAMSHCQPTAASTPEKSSFDVVLTKIDPSNPIAAIKGVRECRFPFSDKDSSLKACKELVDDVRAADSMSRIVLANVTQEQAFTAAKILRYYGCTVEIV